MAEASSGEFEDVSLPSSVSLVHSSRGPLLVVNGLQLLRLKQEQPFRGFTYSPVPQKRQPISVEWRRLLESGVVESEHIRLHDLQREELENDGETLIATLQDDYRTAYAKAVVIISLTQSLALPKGVSKRIEDLTGYPVVVISRSDGEQLMECLNVQYEDEELLARLVVESIVELGMDDDITILHATDSTKPESRGFLSQLLNRRPTFDVRGEVKKLMFDGDIMRKVTEDSGRFTMIMATFSKYEKTASTRNINHSGINHLLERFLRYFNDAFVHEYPFFLILINHMVFKYRAMYECDELPGFFRECINRMETMLPERVEETLMGFIHKKDFDVMDCAEEATTSVFMLLANACLNLMSLSSKVKKKSQSRSGLHAPVPHFVYHRMLWISMHLKLVGEKGMITRSTSRVLEEHFIQQRTTIPINRDTINDFKAGMVVSKLLKLNPEMQFTPQLMVDFLVGKNCIRPLAQIRDFVIAMEAFITSERDMVVTILANTRSWYAEFLFEKQLSSKASEEGTVRGVIDEGISFLDAVCELWIKKGWKRSSLNKDFRICVRDWLLLLLMLVPISESSAVTLLKKFLSPRRGVIADPDYRKIITQKVLTTTKRNFHVLDIHQFFALYKMFRIWPNDFLFDFLKQYQVPRNVKISDPIWTEFFTTILERYRSYLLQLQLLGFLQTVGDCYRYDKRAPEFIPDLLQLNVPRLFATDDQLDGSSVGDQFVDFLKGYVKRHNLQRSLLTLIQSDLSKLTDQEQHNFQQLIFTVLQSEIIPEFKALQGSEQVINQQLKNVLIISVTALCQNMSWFSSHSPCQKFCWGVVAACTSKIPVTAESFDWISAYDYVISTLGQLFNAYVNTRRLRGQECILSFKFPDEVADSSDNVVLYFQWVRKAQDVLTIWQGKFLNNEVNFDDVLVYANHHTSIDRLGRALCADSTVIDGQDLKEVKHVFVTHFDQLNTYLLKYIPGHPEARWITLPALLARYGASLPLQLQEVISKHVLFPGEDKPLVGQLLHNKFPIGNGMFKPGHEIALNLTKDITLRKLLELLQDIMTLLQGILENLDLLVFFHLQQSEIFKMHLMKHLEDATTVVATTDKVQSSFHPVATYQQCSTAAGARVKQQESSVTLDMLEKALENVNSNLLQKMAEGTATYADIVASGALKLESLNIDQEFEIFTEYARYAGFSCIDRLAGVQCILKLFQFTHHIKTIHSVCDQYQLRQCLADPTLLNLMELKKELSSEDSRAKLTPVDAMKKMSFIKTSLCLEGATNFSCLQIFPAVANSAVFYQFIQEKRFTGEKGQALFQQQYQLITAQLQHEEYDDNVLNQLRAGFVFMTPFMDREQSFRQLMSKITRLDTSHSLKQLKTVNENITLVRLWFSRAEGETIENVANELDHILETGIFNFMLSSDETSTADILLVYQPSHPVTAQPDTNSIGREDRERSPLDRGSTLIVDQHWNSEHIADFVRKLGFLDTEREGGERIKLFIHLNSTANKLLELYCKLRELGHPSYQHRVPECLRCNITQQAADQKVLDTEELVFSWLGKVSQLRREYSWLLFFSVPKLLLLHSLVDELQPDLAAIVSEISFLFENDSDVREKLTNVLKGAIIASRSSSGPGSDPTAIVSNINSLLGDWPAKEGVTKHIQEAMASTWTPPIHTDLESRTPMHVLGQLLNTICSHRLLTPHLLKQRTNCQSKPTLGPQISQRNLYQLHYGPSYNSSQIIRMIIEIYQGVPEGFAVFHCRSTTSAEELTLFIERMRHYHLPYLVLQVNQLPFKLQELLMNLPLGVRDGSPKLGREEDITIVHFVETSPSVLRELPWITLKENPESGPEMSIADAGQTCRRNMLKLCDFNCIELVYGHAGDGKTHYITQQLAQSHGPLIISVNEAFNPLAAIKKLKKLPLIKDCAIFFNFTILSYLDGTQQDIDSQYQYHRLMDSINWFFFDFLILGYVEDPVTGHGFRFPGGLEWSVYVEVPSYGLSIPPEDSLALFRQAIPTLALVGSTHQVYSQIPYTVDDEVRLVCKYLSAFKNTQAGNPIKGIDRLYGEAPVHGLVPQPNVHFNHQMVRISLDEAPSDEECHSLLTNYMPDYIQKAKVTQRLFIKYMKRRCSLLDELPAFNFNTGVGEVIDGEDGKPTETDTRHLGSTLMSAMLEEVESFCDPSFKKNWTGKSHQKLIYDFRDGGGSFGLLSLRPEMLSNEVRANFKKIGFKLPSQMNLQKRDVLDHYLARALGLQCKRLAPIDDENFVLTPDYTMKMLNIHERYECGMPVIINGETGVGKTAVVNMLSKLWSHSVNHLWEKKKDSIEYAIHCMLGDLNADCLDNYQSCIQTMQNIAMGKEVTEEELVVLGKLPDASSTSGYFYSRLREHMFKILDDPVRVLLYLPQAHKKQHESREEEGRKNFKELFQQAKDNDSAMSTAALMNGILQAKICNTFHKLDVHAAMMPADIKEFFVSVFKQAQVLKEAYDKEKRKKIKIPFVTVFLDEINTSSSPGLFKEIIVDRTLDGNSIPANLFIVAACNPHRGNSTASHAEETWLRGSYYVRPLHPTLELLMWDYGALDSEQEKDYIRAKMQMLNKQLPNIEVVVLTDLIMESQSLVRNYAQSQLTSQKVPPIQAEVCAQSCVSQRDIQRVFTFYQWLMTVYERHQQHGECTDYPRRAVMVALGIVYYLRLNDVFREKYSQVLDRKSKLPGEVNFSQAFRMELEWFTNKMELPPGIAKTQALMENLFAIVVCTVTHTPLIIVGAPGSSKTLSFNLAITNLKGSESKMDFFREVKLFPSLDPHFYQCSRRTTSNEINTVFLRAINRQRTHAQYSLPIYCVVFMDEAGLPEESHESLKVLHYHLDKREVSFVAISNHVLDAAKTNRAVSLFRPAVSDDDLFTLAKGCLCSTTDVPPPDVRKDLETIVRFCPAYQRLMDDCSQKFARFFGLRDFIYFVNYLRKRRTRMLTPQLVMEALERNFNGVYWGKNGEYFQHLCELFLNKMETSKGKPVRFADVQQRSVLTVLQESLQDFSEHEGGGNEVRYKLIIDPSEDSSLVRLLFRFGILQRDNTRIYVCSNFPGDNQLQKINTIAAIRHSAIEGHTAIMSQTDEIHESFYDLFNQRFRCIDDPDHGPRYYTNIAIGAHLKPCRVHANFQCVVVVHQSEVDLTPAPFLNRFEKYCISHAMLLATAMSQLPPCLRVLVENTKKSVAEFITLVGAASSLYGLQPETLDSLLLNMLPATSHRFQEVPADQPIVNNIRLYLLQQLLTALRASAGFCVLVCNVDELQLDADYILDQLLQHPAYNGALQNMTTDSAYQAVAEAMRVLHTAPAASEEEERRLFTDTELSTEGALVISLLQQWLIRHLCKNLMQLMTTEALTLNRRMIPASYIDHYLTYQQHFSLKELISHHYLAAQCCNGNLNRCATKLLCFTRSSPLIHQLPSSFSCFGSLSNDGESAQFLQQLVFEDTSKLVLHKLTAVQSQSSMQELLRMFVRSPKQQVMVLLVNMKETKKDIVNHLRIMIEEEEVKAPKGNCKMFVMLLHFPSAMFFDACYHTLFLRGWSHCYLDTIGNDPKLGSGIVDIQEWFQRCCFKKSFPEDSLLTACRSLLDDIIPILAVRTKRSFTQYTRASERCKKLRELLLTKGVGEKLCQLFRSCWKPSVLAEYLEKAASFTCSRESSLNVTDAVRTLFRDAFTDFLIYMVSQMNQNNNINVLFTDRTKPDEKNSKPVEELFVALLGCLPIPKLDQLKVFAGSLPVPKPHLTQYSPQFPFFELVYKNLLCEVEEMRKSLSKDMKLLEADKDGEYQPTSESPDMMEQLTISTVKKLEEKLEDEKVTDPVLVCLHALQQNTDLQGHYFTDFAYHVLKVDIGNSPLSGQIIDVIFADILALEPVLKLVYLHLYTTFNKLDLASITVLLRPLETIFHVAEITPCAFSLSGTSKAKQLVDAIQATKHPFGDPLRLSQFIISALFSALVGSVFPQGSELVGCQERFKVWHNTYLSVTSILALKAHLYSQELPDLEQAKFNVMHTTFIMNYIHNSTSDESVFKASQVFDSLFSRHFLSNQLREGQALPQLKDSVAVCSEVLQKGGSAIPNKKLVCRLLEGLFSHYFSSFRRSFSPLDQLWFLQLANTHVTKLHEQSTQFSWPPAAGVDIPPNVVFLATFKLFLSRLLGECDPTVEDSAIRGSGPLLLYNPESRLLVAEVLLSEMDESNIGPYIPIFYQDCHPVRVCPQAENLLMQQPLCHLYFITVMEHLFSAPQDIENLVHRGETISQLCLGTFVSPKERLILQIEKQAVIQAMLKEAASQFAPNNLVPSTKLNSVVEELNVLLADESTGGGAVGGHSLTMAMHLLHQLKSARKFTELLTTKFDVLVNNVRCLHPINQQLKNQTAENKAHLFPFMLAEHSNHHVLSQLYHQVKTAMLAVHSAQASQESVDALLKVAEECNAAPSRTTHHRQKDVSKVNKKTAFRMIVWLVTYYEFYCNKVSSGALHTVVQQRLGHRYFGDEGVVRLIQSFLYPKLLISMPESPVPLREDAQVLNFLADGRVEHIEHGGQKEDPLLNLFKPPKGNLRDQSDVDLCHSLANLIAVILGCQPQSNHLWYNLFAADQLTGTYMPGFMYNHKIDPDGLLYDCGVELTAEGQYGRPDYTPHATRGTYSLHSLYLILFANFGAFSMSLLTQPTAHTKIQGPVISSWQAIRHYCFSQLKSVWMHIQNNLGISEEERSFLIMRCFMNFYETSMEADSGLVGKLHTREKLDKYESAWHNKIYLPAWSELKTKHSVLWQSKVFVNIRMLESRFPQFPNENAFFHHIQSKVGKEERLGTLLQFTMDKARLQVGGQLLPDLIEFYYWLHTHLAYQLTHRMAYNTLTIGRVVHLATNIMPHSLAENIKELYKRVKIGYAEYVDLVGGAIGMGACAALRRGNKIFVIDDDTPLIHFLSDSEVVGEGNDWLFLVIADIAQTQTLFVENLYAEIESSPTHPLTRLLPKDPTYIYPAEASDITAIVRPDKNFHGVSEFLQLVRSRVIMEYSTNCGDPSSSPTVGSKSSLAFSLEELQEDIVAHFVAGKPIIRDIDALRTVFKFREDNDEIHHSRLSDRVGITFNLSLVDLPMNFKVDLPWNVNKRLEYNFHSSSYHSLNELVRGLGTMLGHLATVLADEGVSDHERMTLQQFVISHYGRSTEESSTFTVIGIKNISENQEKHLSELNLIHLYSSLSLFISWIKEERYDYCGLPLALKTHLGTKQITALNSIPATYRKLKGTLNQLQQELKGMGEVLHHVETHLVSLVNKSPQKPLMELLSDLKLTSDSKHLPRLIPSTVCVQHYMSLRLALKRLTTQVKQQLEEDSSVGGNKQWREFVEDLWTSQLAHLREGGDESGGASGYTELADDLNRDLPQEEEQSMMGDPMLYTEMSARDVDPDMDLPQEEEQSMIGDPMLYTELSASSYQNVGPDSVQSTFHFELENLSLRDEDEIDQKKETAKQEAHKWSPENVVDFLRRIGLGKHASAFLDEEVDGLTLLMADQETFDDLGVKLVLERVRIMVLYQRELHGEDGSEPVRALQDLLKNEKNLEQYISKIEHAGVDADMILYANKSGCHDDLLAEAGVNKAVHRTKLAAAVKMHYVPSP